MSKRLTQEEKDKRAHDKTIAKKEREKRREKELRHKRWLRAEKARIRKKKQHFEQVKHVQKRNVLYEAELKNFINSTYLYTGSAPREEKYKFYRFFFPYKNSTATGKLKPITGFSEKVALDFINILLNAGEMYRYDVIYDIFCTHRIRGSEFIKLYNNGINSYRKLFPMAPPEVLYALYNICSPGSTARGAGEYLLCMIISDVTKDKKGDVCTKSAVNLELKAYDGRLSCQKQSDTKAVDECFNRRFLNTRFLESKHTLLGNGMIDCYKDLKKLGWHDINIIELFAECKIETYKKYLSPSDMLMFTTGMTRIWSEFFINGEFTEESVNMINGCHDAYVYPKLDEFTHLKIDSKQPASISKAKEFDVKFSIFDRLDFSKPEKITDLIKSDRIKFYGFIKNDGRDKAVHVGI